MRRVGELFPGGFLVFACLKEQIAPDEKRLIAELARWDRKPLANGRPRSSIIVLTGRELFCEKSIEDTWVHLGGKLKDLAGGHHPFGNLWTLADATQQAYLDLPSLGEEREKKYAARFRKRHS